MIYVNSGEIAPRPLGGSKIMVNGTAVRIKNSDYFRWNNVAYKIGPKTPRKGLVLYLPFDGEKSAAETGQAISLGNPNPPSYTTVDGIPCVYLTGSTYLKLGSEETDMFGGCCGNVTKSVSLMVRAAGFSSTSFRYLFNLGGTHSDQFSLYLTSSGTWAFSAISWAWSNMTENVWTHLYGEYDASTKEVDLYMNNVKSANKIERTGVMYTTPQIIEIGRGGRFQQNHFVGHIAAVRMYNRKLEPYERLELTNEFK